jgi:hypothetical protein
MSDINNINGSQDPQFYPSYTDSPAFKALPPSVQDSLISSFSEEELNERFAGASVDVPSLFPPQTTSGSINDFFKALNDAKIDFNQQLQTAEFIDQLTRRKDSQAAALMVIEIAAAVNKRNTALASLDSQVDTQMDEINSRNQNLVDRVNAQRDLISWFNGLDGKDEPTADQINYYNNMTTDYNSYLDAQRDWATAIITNLKLEDDAIKNGIIPPEGLYADYTSGSNVPQINTFQPLSDSQLRPTIKDNMYQLSVGVIDTQIVQQSAYANFLRLLNIFNPNVDYVLDPILNFKPLVKKILPDAVIDPTQIVQENNSQGVGGLTVQNVLESPHVTAILGKAALAQALRNTNLNLTEEQIEEYSNNLILLSSELISQASSDAFLSSLGLLLPQLQSSPDDPTTSLLFALSFANRINELVGHGLTEEALNTLLSSNPALQNLSEEELAELTAILNLGLLLVASKLLESSLGQPGISEQLLLSLLPPNVFSNIQDQVATETGQLNNELTAQIKNYYLQQGLAEDQATFLANLGQELVSNDPLRPSLTSISEDTLNTQLLTDSIKASLILSDSKNYTLAKADALARDIVNQTLAESEGSTISATHFRANLESALRDNQLPAILVDEILKNVILVSNQNNFAQEQSNLSDLLDDSVDAVIPPGQMNQLISQDIANTYFGTPNPDSRDVANVRSPLSLTNLINDQLRILKIDQDDTHAETTSDAFRASLLTTTDFYAFSLQVMDPAYSLLYSAGTGLMYAGQEPKNWRQSIDIIV